VVRPNPEQITAFLSGERVGSARFQMNDYVIVTSGEHSGQSGSIVSLELLDADPLYLLETESGADVGVRESEIESAPGFGADGG
jgi:ribosomal protein S4E